MIDIDWKPNNRKLRQFAVASLFGFPLIGLLLTKLLHLFGVTAHPQTVVVAAVLGAIVCGLGLLFPQVIKPIYLALVAIALPIGLALSCILLPIVYYGFFTPVALGLKILGKDPMDRSMEKQDSYWIDRKPAPAASQYYKQY